MSDPQTPHAAAVAAPEVPAPLAEVPAAPPRRPAVAQGATTHVRCTECNGHNVEYQTWVAPNTNTVVGDDGRTWAEMGGRDLSWCGDCGAHTLLDCAVSRGPSTAPAVPPRRPAVAQGVAEARREVLRTIAWADGRRLGWQGSAADVAHLAGVLRDLGAFD